jgi:hypothetical protein
MSLRPRHVRRRITRLQAKAILSGMEALVRLGPSLQVDLTRYGWWPCLNMDAYRHGPRPRRLGPLRVMTGGGDGRDLGRPGSL